MIFENLIKSANLEDYETEFKGLIEEGPDSSGGRKENGWLKELVAFANSFGGTLYIGVDNKTHEVLALSHENADKVSLMVQRLVDERIEPHLVYRIGKIEVPNTSPTRYVLFVKVEKSKYPPISLRFDGVQSFYVRHFGKTSIATGEEIRNMILNSDSVSYDSLPTSVKYDLNNFKYLRSAYFKNTKKELTVKDLININFITPDGYLNKGSLLFADNCDDNRTLVECSQFLGVSKGETTFYATKTIKGNLLYELDEIISFITSHSASGYTKTPTGTKGYVSYPRRALLEGVVNALGHRNYFIGGSQIEINIYKDRLEIISPGSLVGSKWLNKEKNLSALPPIRRNEILCFVFSICGFMDHKGSGFDKIQEDYKPYGPLFAPYVDSNDSFFSLTLPDLTHEGGLVGFNENPKVYTRENLEGKYSIDILSYCYNKPRSAKEIATLLSIKPSTYFRDSIIKPLVEKDYLLALNQGGVTVYSANINKVFPI